MEQGQGQNWANEFNHDSLGTPESKEAFVKTMSKYESPEAAIVGGFNAIKSTGAPYRLPESLDKMPGNTDEEREKNRSEMMGKIGKLIGAVEKPEDLQDIDWLLDSTLENDKPDENLVKAITEFAVAEKAPKALIQKLAGLWNRIQADGRSKQAEAQEQAKALGAAKIKEVNDKLLADAGGNAEELKSKIELVKRVFLNNANLNAREYEELAHAMFDEGLVGNYTFNKALIGLAQNFQSGTTKTGDGVPPPKPKPVQSNIPEAERAAGIIS